MIFSKIFDPVDSKLLLGFDENFDFFNKLILGKKFPKVVLLTGEKGSGKFTFINHFMHFYFDSDKYDFKNKVFLEKTTFHTQFKNNVFPNIFYLRGADFQNIKIEDIRFLKEKLLNTPIINDKRFIILDDVDSFNLNSLNALLKLIEEPSINNHFILINNKSKNLLATIKSRCLELKIIFNNKKKEKIINSLIKVFNQNVFLEMDLVNLSPGNYLKYNYFFGENKMNLKNNLLENVRIILKIYKKEKDIFFKDLLIFLSEYYFQSHLKNNFVKSTNLLDKRLNILENIDNFFVYNLNQNSLLNSIEKNIYE